MDLTSKELGDLIYGMREAYSTGNNAMEFARKKLSQDGASRRNKRLATLIAYDLQAGTYVANARTYPHINQRWCHQLAELIDPFLPSPPTCQPVSILELGVGEATTMSGLLSELGGSVQAFGFDISWSRIKVANDWLHEQSKVADLFVGDILNIPMSDNSIDVVYSSHSLEPNGGFEVEAIKECLRVARHAVVLVEPLYELASLEAQARMRHHGYVRGLHETAERLGAEILEYRLLEFTSNPLNPSGVLAFRKVNRDTKGVSVNADAHFNSIWQCPLTGTQLTRSDYGFNAQEMGIVYPVLGRVPMLRTEHAIIASKYSY